MSKPEGLYLSTDFRLTAGLPARVVDDAAVKMLTINFPPLDSGTRGLLAYTGMARLPSGSYLGPWLVETLRGEAQVPDELMAHLGARLARDVAPSRTGLIINAFFIEGENGDRRLLGGFSNMKIDPSSKAVSVTPSFEYTMQELTNPIAFANGSGAATVLADGHFATMQHHLSVRSTRATEHMGLLAAINRRAAARDRLVSPASHVAFISARRPTPGASGGRFASQSRTYTFRGESAPIAMPFLLAGVDLTPMMLFTQRLLEATKRGEQPPPDMTIEEWNRHLRRRD